MQVACDLHVAREGAGECYRRRPCSAVVGVDYLQCSSANREVVKGYVHAPVVGAGRVVVHPHALAVASATTEVGRARTGGPGDAVGRSPQADALPAAAGRQVAGEPHAQVRVVHHDRIAEVGAVAGAKGLAWVPGDPVIGRIGDAAVTTGGSAAVVIVHDPGVGAVAPFHALRLGNMGKGAVRKDDINVSAADKQGLRQEAPHPLGERVAAGS